MNLKPDHSEENLFFQPDKIYKTGLDPEKDAWFTAFYIENHLDYYTFPDQAASEEQIRFMVYTEEGERYYPCSEPMFDTIMNQNQMDRLDTEYQKIYKKILAVIEDQIESENEKKYLSTLISIKFKHETRDKLMIPSRVEKRLMKIFLNRTQIRDPFKSKKSYRNNKVDEFFTSAPLQKVMNTLDPFIIAELPSTLNGIRASIDEIRLRRLLSLSVSKDLWESDSSLSASDKFCTIQINREITGNGVLPLMKFLGLSKDEPEGPKKILWLANESGEIIIDLAIIRLLTKMGHKIIISVKNGPVFTQVDADDIEMDPVLFRLFEGATRISDDRLSKNDLLDLLRRDSSMFAVSDGTSEMLNLLMTSTTFARIFKEVDGVISRGNAQYQRFFNTHFEFTQNIFNIASGKDGSCGIAFKPRHRSVIKYTHQDLENKAKQIIEKMQKAKRKGMTVVFYSGIIGSIPGKIAIAKEIMSVFVKYLEQQFAKTFIINPSEYFEEGMDADDLMYMWEIVQTSGFIDIWRFQSYDDISKSFELMKKKVPPEWVGKDSTFSTGCTKEMNIALRVQKNYPEMQIIGPAKEKFMRRSEYGVGKMYDRRLSHRKDTSE